MPSVVITQLQLSTEFAIFFINGAETIMEVHYEDWMENVKGSLLPCYNSSEGQPLDRIINSYRH